MQLVACSELAEFSDETPTCETSEDCPTTESCVDKVCVAPTEYDDPAPHLEREADNLGKLGVERDMLESKVKVAREQLTEAGEELLDAKSNAEKKAARQKKSRAAADHKSAIRALEAFKKQHRN